MMNRAHMRPSYRNQNGDPVRWLLAAAIGGSAIVAGRPKTSWARSMR